MVPENSDRNLHETNHTWRKCWQEVCTAEEWCSQWPFILLHRLMNCWTHAHKNIKTERQVQFVAITRQYSRSLGSQCCCSSPDLTLQLLLLFFQLTHFIWKVLHLFPSLAFSVLFPQVKALPVFQPTLLSSSCAVCLFPFAVSCAIHLLTWLSYSWMAIPLILREQWWKSWQMLGEDRATMEVIR